MPELPPIAVIVLLAVSAFGMVMILTMLRWPTVPAYFIAGACVGPSGLGVLHDNETAHFIAELGIIFLLFTIGLKFSISGLRTIRRYVFGLGGAQTFLTGMLFGMPVWFFYGDVPLALLVGSVAAMSSTAIVSQILIEENTLNSPSGSRAMGVLLFQDLAVIPLIIVFSSSFGASSALNTAALVGVKVAAIMAIVLFAGAPAMSRWLNFVAGYGNKELYMLNLVMLIIALSGFSAWAGLSYALGAFVAGILMSETMHRYRVSRIVEPFRHIFLGFFFMSLGILVDPGYLLENWALALGAAALLIAVKAPLIYGCTRILGAHAKTAIYTAVLLCGAGEFGFVLLTLARTSEMVDNGVFQLLLSANLAALIVIPFLWRQRQRFVRYFARDDWLASAKKVTENLSETMALSDHVIICGFGRTGQAVAGILRDIGLPYVALEENYQILQTVGGADHVLYAESSSVEGLTGANIMRARALIMSYIDAVDSKTTVQRARALNPKIYIIARADTVKRANELVSAGADLAYLDVYEFGFSAAKKTANACYRMNGKAVNRAILRARDRENPYFTGEFSADLEDPENAETFVGCVPQQDIPSLETALEGCQVISWLRAGEIINAQDTRRTARAGDEIVISGGFAKVMEIKKNIESPDGG
ncbi:MAG: cation:proton antiporter [Gammaproteobacteria bacterium]